jgi:hypothetical protein
MTDLHPDRHECAVALDMGVPSLRGKMAEREGFEPSIELFNPITV